MIKRETFELLKKIAGFYDQFEVDQEKVNLWHEILREYTLAEIQGNLFTFVKNSSYPPKLAELITHDNLMKMVPTLEETRQTTSKLMPASETVVRKELAKMRTILGITREGK
ncbi:hypothetical protein G6549_27150 [Bacillus sp. MM2020_1]|nr:hypothetical protein [Bacillus sp. MM2020_1]